MLQNKNTHLNCFCYQNGAQPLIELKTIQKAKSGSVKVVGQEVLFVVRGAVEIKIVNAENKECVVMANQFVFIPTGAEVDYRVTADNSVVLICRIMDEVPECHVFRVNKMSGESAFNGLYVANFKPRITHFVKGLYETMSDGLKCRIYTELEVSRMLFLIHAYYPYEECLKIFSPIASPDVRFSEFVRLNYADYRTIEALAGAVCMSSQQFSKRFKTVFGKSPREWIQEERAKNIYHDICQSSKSLKEIGMQHGFIQSNFIRYCRARFGMSPGMIRRQLKRAEGHTVPVEEEA